jgi:hypothetical protein
MTSKFAEMFEQQKGKGQKAESPPGESESADPNVYIGCDYNRNGRPVMGFYIEQKNGTLDGFMYHGINHPKFQVRDGEEFLSFTYSGTAVVMTGTGLRRIFEALMRHTLRAIYEYDGRSVKDDDTPVITRVSVTQAIPMRAVAPPELVRPAKQAS